MKNNYFMFSAKHLKNNQRESVGRLGESAACWYLKRKRYKILKRNYREKFDEIDIIAKSLSGCLVFIEVKTMFYMETTNENKLTPEDNFTTQKFKRIRRLCEMFSAKHRKIINSKIGWRIDLIAVEINKIKADILIKHYKNVYK